MRAFDQMRCPLGFWEKKKETNPGLRVWQVSALDLTLIIRYDVSLTAAYRGTCDGCLLAQADLNLLAVLRLLSVLLWVLKVEQFPHGWIQGACP